MNKLNYRNITISGLIGTGTTTLFNNLKTVFPDFTFFCGGEYMRQYAVKKGLFDSNNKFHHKATAYSDDFDREIDFGMRQDLTKKDKLIIESWLCGFVAQGVPGVLKVLLTCDNALRIDRIVNRDSLAVEDAKKHIHEREKENLEKWTGMYKQEWQEWIVNKGIIGKNEPINFWDGRIYDLVIDTYSHSKEEVLNIVLEKLGYKK